MFTFEILKGNYFVVFKVVLFYFLNKYLIIKLLLTLFTELHKENYIGQHKNDYIRQYEMGYKDDIIRDTDDKLRKGTDYNRRKTIT